MINNEKILEKTIKSLTGYNDVLLYNSTKIFGTDFKTYKKYIYKAVTDELNHLIQFGVFDIFEKSYDYFFQNYNENKYIINILLTSFASNSKKEQEIEELIIKKETLFNSNNNFPLKKHLDLIFNVDYKNTEEIVLQSNPIFLNILLNNYYQENNYSKEAIEKSNNDLLLFCINNKLDNKINYFLSQGAKSPENQKNLFLTALNNKDLFRINLMWNPIENPLDITQFIEIPIPIMKKFKVQRLELFSLFSKPEHIFFNEEEKEHIFNKLVTNSFYIYKDKVKNNFNFNFNNLQKDCEEPNWINLIQKDLDSIEKQKIDDLVVSTKKIDKPINPFIMVGVNSIDSKVKNQETEIIKKSLTSENFLFNFNNEKISRKELQKKWDKKLIHSFFKPPIYMKNLINEFYLEEKINEDLLKEYNIIIYRQPLKEFQLFQTNIVFICNFLKPLANLLFSENKETILLKENYILNNIVSQKLRTSLTSEFNKNKEDIKELNKTSKEYNSSKETRVLVRFFKEETSTFNWKKVK